MGKKCGHKKENNQVEEGNAAKKESDVNVSKSSNRDDDKNKRKEDSNEKNKDRIKKMKAEFVTDEKDLKRLNRSKKCKLVAGKVKEISTETCVDGKRNTEQESNEAVYMENNFGQEAKTVSKAKHKKENRDGIDALATVTESLKHGKTQEPVEVQKICSTKDINEILHGKEGEYKKLKKKKKPNLEKGIRIGHSALASSITDGNDLDNDNSAGNEVECKKLQQDFSDAEDGNKGRKKKSKSVKNDSDVKHHKGDARTRKSVNTTNQSENATSNERSKKVSFQDHVEVFPSADVIDDANKDVHEGLVYGRRFSKEENEIVMNAVANYIESHNLGDEGLNMVLNCRVFPQVKNCWKEIQAAIPWRPLESVYHRAHIIFERDDEKRPWTPEEFEVIQKFVEEHGPKWKLLAESLGKHRHHVKDTWRRIKLANLNKGHWSQEEYQNLFDLVNLDLSMKAYEEKKSKHGMLRDNICWTAISEKMQSRTFASCCEKWYRCLASPMVAEGIWADADDYRMLDALSSLDACCMEDVDWDNLMEHRSGYLCRKRWNQMVRHLGPHRGESFAEQVEILANRYRPDMLDARETYDKKCPVDLP